MKLFFHSYAADDPLSYLISGIVVMALAAGLEGLRFVHSRMESGDLRSRAAVALVHMIAMTMAYALMLCVMTMDWLWFASIIAGFGAGHIIFYQKTT